MVNLSKEERETIILYTEVDDRAEVYTHNKRLINRLSKFCKDRPDEIQKIRESETGAVTYTVPRDWVRVSPKRKMSDAQQAAASERLAAIRSM